MLAFELFQPPQKDGLAGDDGLYDGDGLLLVTVRFSGQAAKGFIQLFMVDPLSFQHAPVVLFPLGPGRRAGNLSRDTRQRRGSLQVFCAARLHAAAAAGRWLWRLALRLGISQLRRTWFLPGFNLASRSQSARHTASALARKLSCERNVLPVFLVITLAVQGNFLRASGGVFIGVLPIPVGTPARFRPLLCGVNLPAVGKTPFAGARQCRPHFSQRHRGSLERLPQAHDAFLEVVIDLFRGFFHPGICFRALALDLLRGHTRRNRRPRRTGKRCSGRLPKVRHMIARLVRAPAREGFPSIVGGSFA